MHFCESLRHQTIDVLSYLSHKSWPPFPPLQRLLQFFELLGWVRHLLLALHELQLLVSLQFVNLLGLLGHEQLQVGNSTVHFRRGDWVKRSGCQ